MPKLKGKAMAYVNLYKGKPIEKKAKAGSKQKKAMSDAQIIETLFSPDIYLPQAKELSEKDATKQKVNRVQKELATFLDEAFSVLPSKKKFDILEQCDIKLEYVKKRPSSSRNETIKNIEKALLDRKDDVKKAYQAPAKFGLPLPHRSLISDPKWISKIDKVNKKSNKKYGDEMSYLRACVTEAPILSETRKPIEKKVEEKTIRNSKRKATAVKASQTKSEKGTTSADKHATTTDDISKEGGNMSKKKELSKKGDIFKLDHSPTSKAFKSIARREKPDQHNTSVPKLPEIYQKKESAIMKLVNKSRKSTSQSVKNGSKNRSDSLNGAQISNIIEASSDVKSELPPNTPLNNGGLNWSNERYNRNNQYQAAHIESPTKQGNVSYNVTKNETIKRNASRRKKKEHPKKSIGSVEDVNKRLASKLVPIPFEKEI